MSELSDKVNMSIERLKAYEPEEGYYLAFSGGKDSVVTKAIADLAGVKYHAHYRITTVDPPELVRFIKEKHPDVSRDAPRYPADYKNTKLAGKPITMWNLIPEKMMPPTRLSRYCCEKLKEDGGDGGICVTGVRWAESTNRKHNQGGVVIHGDFRQEQNPDQIGMYFQFFNKVKIGKLNYHPSEIPWAEFGREAEAHCKILGLDYYIKDSLRAEMEKDDG